MIKLCKKLQKDVGSIGIGAMIVFIAMVLVAGIAASVLIQTSTQLEAQAMTTGRETTDEVSGGLAVFDIEGHVDATQAGMDCLAITVRTRAGSPGVDLNQSIIVLTDGSTKVILTYDYVNEQHFNATVDEGVFDFSWADLNEEKFGIMVLEDADGSCGNFTPVINSGDKVMLFVDADACFGTPGIPTRAGVSGFIFPEYGSPGVIYFRTPAAYSDIVYDLQ
jgi:flagellin FlaB